MTKLFHFRNAIFDYVRFPSVSVCLDYRQNVTELAKLPEMKPNFEAIVESLVYFQAYFVGWNPTDHRQPNIPCRWAYE